VDLSNYQVYLRKKRRIRKSTWREWCSGIEANLTPGTYLGHAWDLICTRLDGAGSNQFAELRVLSGKTNSRRPRWTDDPFGWE
jgi:hypothetical protein